jgi:hypothetical protein
MTAIFGASLSGLRLAGLATAAFRLKLRIKT